MLYVINWKISNDDILYNWVSVIRVLVVIARSRLQLKILKILAITDGPQKFAGGLWWLPAVLPEERVRRPAGARHR